MKKKTYINKKVSSKGRKKDEYDVIIVGAGIGGLVCGCYLAKAGMKVAIFEKNNDVGGYCSSFTTHNFTFDSCVHSFGDCSTKSPLGKIIAELKPDIKIARSEYSDIVIAPDFNIEIKGKIKTTIFQLRKAFPREKNIERFLRFLEIVSTPELYLLLARKTFKNLLDEFFFDKKIKAFFSIFLGNMGVPSSKISAFTAILFLKSFVFSGGYYPIGGMQRFSHSLRDRFKKYGGKIFCRNEVREIKIKRGKAMGVCANNGFYISTNVVSNVDARQTFLRLIKNKKRHTSFISKLKKLSPSSSAFIVYLGLTKLENNPFKKYLGIWKMPKDYNVEKTLTYPLLNKFSKDDFIFCSSPSYLDESSCHNGFQIMRLLTTAPFKNEVYWKTNKDSYREALINRTESLFPAIRNHIIFQDSATPQTLYRHTFNYRGAMCGWHNSIQQNNSILLENHGFENLYLTGHWLLKRYGQSGITMVAFSGKNTAQRLLNRLID